MADYLNTKRIYLDNAATSWPKPPEVVEAIAKYYRDQGNPASRGSAGSEVDRAIAVLRKRLALFLGASTPCEIVFAFNATDALNMAIHGSLAKGDHVVAGSLEHNSVLRPLNYLKDKIDVELTFVKTNEAGVVDPDEVANAIRRNTRMVILSHVSNVTGVVQPVNEIGAICRDRGVFFLVDAAQSLGHLEVNVDQMNCDMLAAPGHKGLFGPLGTGILYIRSSHHNVIRPLRQGGTGSSSNDQHQPLEMPSRLESGNINVGGLLGLSAGLEFVETMTVAKIAERDDQFRDQMLGELGDISSVILYCGNAQNRTSVISCNIGEMDSREVATILQSHFGVEVRAGLQCAPRMHKALGTFERGGTVRISPGYFNTIDEINLMVEAIREIAS